MIGNYSARLTGSKRNLLALLASSLVFSVGCSNMSSTAPMTNPFSSPADVSGNIHGGNQPVIGATVNLWFAGQNSAAVLAATTTTNSTGFFTFQKAANNLPNTGTTSSFSCPTTGAGSDPLVYVVAKGGNTQNNGNASQNNAAAAFIGVYAICSTITSANQLNMTEVTTVATMAAVQQFYNPANDNITADGTGQQKTIVTNIPNTIALMANAATGVGVPSTSLSPAAGGSIAPGVSVTATPEAAKINLMANILSACINAATAADPNCTALFSAAAPPQGNATNLNVGTFPAATNTLQALFYMLTNPSGNASAGFGGVANIATLFALSPAVGAPYQPSLATAPTDWTIGISYKSTSSCTTGNFISSPVDINIDKSDNVWFANAQAGGNLSGISAAGAPLYCVNFDPGTSSAGGVLDSAGNVWTAGGTTLYRYNPSTKSTLGIAAGVAPLAITADGAGNVFFSAVTGGTGSVYEVVGGASAIGSVTPVVISNTVGSNPARLMADASSTTPTTTSGNVWVSSGSTFISQLTPSTATGNMNGFTTTLFTTSGNSYGITLSHANNVFVSSINNNKIDQFADSNGTWGAASGWPFAAATAGISSPTAISVDGRSSVWIPNNGSSSLSDISFFGANPLSPATGFQKAATFLNANRALAIDQAGNVWVVGDGNNFVTEIVGGAVPMFQPYAFGISVGRFQQIP
jgi:hypothetical protein